MSSSADEIGSSAGVPWEGLYQQDGLLVMQRDALLPDICVKSNVPAEGSWIRRTLSWHEPILWLVLLAGALPYIIVSVICTKRSTVYFGLSRDWVRKRNRIILLSWTIFILSLATGGFGIVQAQDDPRYGWLIAVSVLAALAAALYGCFASRMVAAQRMDDEYIWIKGVHPDFVAQLPPLRDARRHTMPPPR